MQAQLKLNTRVGVLGSRVLRCAGVMYFLSVLPCTEWLQEEPGITASFIISPVVVCLYIIHPARGSRTRLCATRCR